MGTDAVAGLAPSGSDRQSVDMAAPSAPGTYYYGACVDAVAGESDTANNCSTSVQVTVREPDHPDLTVVSPSVSDNSPAAGVSFTLSATVQNDGNGESAATTLRYFRSTDATITTSDTEVGTDAVAGLAPSGSDSQSVELVAPSAPGTYHYGACVDAAAGESNTTNNCSTSVQVTVREPDRPDLTVVSPSVSDNSPAPGASFTLSATVQNDGNGESAATTLRYYRSTDGTITTSDTEVGTDAVAGLAPSGSDSQSVELVAPSAPGPYYYGACVDAVAGESNTANNCSTSVQVTVLQIQQQLQGGPDLEVGTPTVSDTSLETGVSFTLSATVSNAGDGESVATTLRYYRSTDATITTSDTPVGTGAVGTLAAAETSSQPVSLIAPSSPGTYYYGACVDAVTGESDATNNCSASVTVTAREPRPADLAMDAPTVPGSYSSPTPGGYFYFQVTVRNTGDRSAPSTALVCYRSTDATITPSDTSLGRTSSIGSIAAGGTYRTACPTSAPLSPAVTYYYGACVDAVAGEPDTANNCSPSVAVTAPDISPDLVVGGGRHWRTLQPGADFQVLAWVRNTGDGDSRPTTLRFYYSTDATITRSDTPLGTVAIGGLDAGRATRAEVTSATAPSSVGTYHYGACVDAVVRESDTGNNCSLSVTVTVPPPDLVLRVFLGHISSPLVGATVTLAVSVRNLGSGASPSTTLRYYRSTDASITTSDTQVGTAAVDALLPSHLSREHFTVAAPSSPGTYYYGMCVDAVTDESNTTNNCSGSVGFTVRDPAPDLVVGSPTVSDGSPASGASFTLSATVRNAGDGASPSTTLRYYRSTDAAITTSDTSVGTATTVGALAIARTSSGSTSLTAPSSSGTYYYGACVDAVTGESDTTNNCSSSVQVNVGG